MKTSDLTRQNAQELACRGAVSLGFALMRRGDLEILRVFADGKTDLLVRDNDHNVLWHRAYEVVQAHLADREAGRLNKDMSPRAKWFWGFVHNAVIHPVMPFTWGQGAAIVDKLHDFTAELAFDH